MGSMNEPPVRWLMLLPVAALACTPEAGNRAARDPRPAPPASVGGPEAPRPRPPSRRTAVRSCPPPSAKPADVVLDPQIRIGPIAGLSWIFGYTGSNAVLAHLG